MLNCDQGTIFIVDVHPVVVITVFIRLAKKDIREVGQLLQQFRMSSRRRHNQTIHLAFKHQTFHCIARFSATIGNHHMIALILGILLNSKLAGREERVLESSHILCIKHNTDSTSLTTCQAARQRVGMIIQFLDCRQNTLSRFWRNNTFSVQHTGHGRWIHSGHMRHILQSSCHCNTYFRTFIYHIGLLHRNALVMQALA